MTTNNQKVIYIASGPQQAHMLKNALREQGIFAFISNETLQVAMGDLPAGVPTAPRVVVNEEDAEEAREIALEFEQAYRQSGCEVHTDTDDEDEADRLEAAVWPACPHCNRRRHTSCPVCETAGTSFPQAYVPPETIAGRDRDDLPERLLVICPTCDEPFVPEFAARCEWCGHRFNNGRELPIPVPAVTFDDVNYRAWLVLAGLVAVVGTVLALFSYIASPR